MRAPLFLITALALAGCAGQAPKTTVQDAVAKPTACAEVFATGAVFTTVDQLQDAWCDRGDGQLYLPGTATTPCADGSTLYWNDEGWGYLGGPLTRHAPTAAAKVAPQPDREAC